MSAPKWLESIIREFGEALSLKNFGLNERGAAVLRFETGSSLRFEYAFDSLVLAMAVPSTDEPEQVRRALLYSQPERRPGFRLRVTYLAKSESVMMAARLSEREVTLASINTVFNELWNLAEDFRRRSL